MVKALTHPFFLLHRFIGTAGTLHDFGKLTDMVEMVSYLRVVFLHKTAGLLPPVSAQLRDYNLPAVRDFH